MAMKSEPVGKWSSWDTLNEISTVLWRFRCPDKGQREWNRRVPCGQYSGKDQAWSFRDNCGHVWKGSPIGLLRLHWGAQISDFHYRPTRPDGDWTCLLRSGLRRNLDAPSPVVGINSSANSQLSVLEYKFVLPIAETFQDQVEKSFENQRLKNLDGPSTLRISTELLHERSSSGLCEWQKLSSGDEIRDFDRQNSRCHWPLAVHVEKDRNLPWLSLKTMRWNMINLPINGVATTEGCRVTLVGKAETVPMSLQLSFSRSTIILKTTLDYRLCLGSLISTLWRWWSLAHRKMANQLEVQQESLMLNWSDPEAILSFFRAV